MIPDELPAAYLGAGSLDQSSAPAMLRSAFGGRDHWADSPAAPVFNGLLTALEAFVAAGPETENVSATPAAELALGAENTLQSVGKCLSPVIDHLETIQVDPVLPVRSGDLAVLVCRLGIMAKIAVYLGRMRSPSTDGVYADRGEPDYLEIFYQNDPQAEVCVADFDFVGAYRIVRIGEGDHARPVTQWPFPGLRDRVLRHMFDGRLSLAVLPVPAMSMKLALVIEVGNFCGRLHELKKGAI
jgi:hypothetical protein